MSRYIYYFDTDDLCDPNFRIALMNFMINYIQDKIDRYKKMDNMHQVIDILRALICDIKLDIRRLEDGKR